MKLNTNLIAPHQFLPKLSKSQSWLSSLLLCSTMLSINSSALADCVTTASVMTCTGNPDGFDGVGTWALGIPAGPKTLVNDGTLNPDAAASAILFYGDGWNITNNGTMSKSDNIGTIFFRMASNASTQSTLTNNANASIISSGGIGAIVLGYGGSYTNNLRISNSGLISQPTTSTTATYPGAIFIGPSSFNISIINTASGSIIGGDGSNGFHSAISNEGQISSIGNSGLMKAVGPSPSAILNNGGTIGTFVNAGTIQSIGSVSPVAVNLSVGSVSQLLNSGLIEASGSSSSQAIRLYNTTINSIRNSGAISSEGHGITLDAFSSITNFVNTGTISSSTANRFGINNAGTINTLSNSQSVTYSGNLPLNYYTIIGSPTRYGQLQVSNPSGITNYGIYQTSNLSQNTVYTNVITGVTAANFTNGTVPAGRFGTGAMVTQIPWYLTNRGTNWDLVTQLSPVQSVNPVVPGSSSGTSLANAIANTTVIASNGGTNPTLTNGTSFSGAVQNLTSSQVDTLINAHAEGYSSNMTILMERMAGISNAVMDRIHGSGTTRTASIQADQAEKDKFMWAEVSGTRGFVDNYSNLAGFGYNIADIMAGFDLYRSEKGGIGVFVGGGTSRMIESNQVRQTFNSTNGYGGIYGATFLPNELRLSGSLGYMHSSTNAQRIVPDIGAFTGGTAQDVYTSDGAFGAIKLSRPIAVYGRMIVTPFIGQTYSRLWVGKINEAGGGDFNFSINASTGQSAVSFVGVDFVMPVTEAVKDPLSVIGVARYGHDWFANTNSAHEVVAQSPIYGAFTQIGANMGPNGLQLGLGLQGGITDSISLRAGVVGQINTHGREIGAGGRLRVLF